MLCFQEQGDLEAFGELFERRKDGVVDFLAGLARNRVIAEDISQQVWTKVLDLAQRGAYRKEASFRTFLHTLGRNLYIDEYHRKHAETRKDALDEQTLGDVAERSDPDVGVGLAERSAILTQVMTTLPLEQREVLAMWSTGTSIDAMVEITGAPRDTVLSRKKYGIKKLREALVAAGIQPGAL